MRRLKKQTWNPWQNDIAVKDFRNHPSTPLAYQGGDGTVQRNSESDQVKLKQYFFFFKFFKANDIFQAIAVVFINFCWSTVDLQDCVSFCCTSK